MSLLLNTLSRYVIAFFLPRSKHLLTLYDFSFALRWSSREETPQVQGKRSPSKTVGVARGHQRADTLKPYSQRTSQSNHTRTTALSNSMKPNHACRAHQDGRVMVERTDRMRSTGEGNDKPLQYSCLENPMNSMKRQNDRILKEEFLSW